MVNRSLSKTDPHWVREKHNVALASLLAAAGLTTMKLVVGVATMSLGILAEAAHSALDLIATAVTLWAVRMSAKPPDRSQTYGYGKFENLAALIETVLLLVTCLWIVYEAATRLFLHEAAKVNPSAAAFVVVVVSMVVDFWRSRSLKSASEKFQSRALEADAVHFATDIWSSGVVLLGLAGVWIARKLELPWLESADTVAALGVAAIVVWISLKLGKKSVDDLLDRIPDGLRDKVFDAASRVSGVDHVTKLRMRRSGPEVFADVTLSVGSAISFERAHEIAESAEDAVRSILPEADVVVHAEPPSLEALDATTRVRILAARRGLGAHAIRFVEEQGQRWLEMHMEVPDQLTLDEAHRQTSNVEREIRSHIPGLTRVVSHIEPAGESTALVHAIPADAAPLLAVVQQFFAAEGIDGNPHNFKTQHASGKLEASFHIRLNGSTSIAAAHDLTMRLENYLRLNLDNLGHIVIHVEPNKRFRVEK